jgi:hypothetical protein
MKQPSGMPVSRALRAASSKHKTNTLGDFVNNQLDERQDDQLEGGNFPKMEVHVDQSNLVDATTDMVFRALLALDIVKACAAIGGTAKRSGRFEEEPNIFVTVTDSGFLQMTVCTDVGVWLNMTIDPANFDRRVPKHENLLQRCGALVKAIHEAPMPAEEDEGEGPKKPRFGGFEFWKWTEMRSPEDLAPNWAKLAEVWAETVK